MPVDGALNWGNELSLTGEKTHMNFEWALADTDMCPIGPDSQIHLAKLATSKTAENGSVHNAGRSSNAKQITILFTTHSLPRFKLNCDYWRLPPRGRKS